MKLRTMLLFGVTAVLFSAGSAIAQGRFEVTPFVGYETSASYPLSYQSSNSQTPIDRLRVNDALSFGTFLGYNLTENAQLEFMWVRNNTSFSAHNPFTGNYFNAFHSEIDQYQFGGLYMLRNSEHKLRPYLAASLGFTHGFNSNGNPNSTDFAFSLGGGVKYYLTRHIGLRGDIRYMPTYGSSSYENYCDPFFGCYSAKVSHYLNRANFVGGVIFHF